jgi:glycosyltransferase involved in cell wall biosynthesis
MSKMIDLGVCILFYNKLDQTKECIKSFLPSKVPIYILNNGSTEENTLNMESYINEFPHIKMYSDGKNFGVGPGRNYLLKQTNHSWLFFVDNDITIKTENWLENLAKHISYSCGIDAFIPRIFNLRENVFTIKCDLYIDNAELKIVEASSDYTNWFMGGGSIVNRSVYNKFGYYDEHMKVGFEDYEFALRGIKSNNQIVAKNIFDITLDHDHRFSPKVEDKESSKVRYSYELQRKSEERLQELYGVRFTDYKDWLISQKMQITSKHYNKFQVYLFIKRKIKRVYEKVTN